VILNTIHAAKGKEYAHVLLCGDWSGAKPADIEEERRVLYVGMTRARHTLAIFRRMDSRNPFAGDLAGPCFAVRRESAGGAAADLRGHDFVLLGLDDVFLDFAGRCAAHDPVHAALAALQPGDSLNLCANGERQLLVNPGGTVVAQFSADAAKRWRDRLSTIERARVVCMIARLRGDCRESEYSLQLRTDKWEIPVCELAVATDDTR